ncbi:MAG: type II toxin-antitoxin system PemK/MazF family toxin [Spirochaetaceae bacterium]|nr:type II toxin-antitoxin system PemK/MazF family toxin [Spirochaetaceae bacterium]
MYSRGDIVLIPVPFSDLSASKKRPVLVISNNSHNKTNQDMIVVAVTSNLAQPGIHISTNDMIKGQLPKPSIIRSDKIYTLDQAIVVKNIACVSDVVLKSVKASVISLISEESEIQM